MVSHRTRPAGSSRDRIVQAASVEFATRGFAGARVDQIAKRARINKAMLYYHFDDKSALYREILRELFESVARRLREALTAGETPDERLYEFIRIVADETAARPLYPRIWLREMAEGGRHLDSSIVKAIAGILAVLSAIVAEGRARGTFRSVEPLVVQMSIVAPLLLFAASAPIRRRFGSVVAGAAAVPREAMVEYLERASIAALRPGPAPHVPRPTPRRKPS
jgi:TetR/AcrR family transcriptional regulator